MKGFIDRVFLPEFSFKKREGSVWWDKLLSGKSVRIFCALDQPSWCYKFINKSPSHYAMKKLTLNFVGIKLVTTTMAPIRLSKEKFRSKWLNKIEKIRRENK